MILFHNNNGGGFSSVPIQIRNIVITLVLSMGFLFPQEELQVYLGFGQVDVDARTAEIIMNVNDPPGNNGVSGIQFSLTNALIEDVYGGYVFNYFAMATSSDSLVLVFGDYIINEESGVLLNVQFQEFLGDEICFSDVYISQPDGSPVPNLTIGDCVSLGGCDTDFNDDGSLDVLDVLFTVDCIMNYNGSDQCQCADLNSDSSVDVLDVLVLVEMILG